MSYYYATDTLDTDSSLLYRHWVEVGDAALGKHITDVKPGGKTASGCHELSDADKLINAQNYAFFASVSRTNSNSCDSIADHRR
jgi:hypothetical protein